MGLNRWWAGDARERYWLESTDRPDIGANLRAPLADESGRDNWRYTIAREARIGDLVFHYDKAAKAITAVSRISAAAFDAPILWAARGSYARERGATPQLLPGYQIPLDRHHRLAAPVTLEQLRGAKDALSDLHARLAKSVGDPLYFPFELAERDLRPLQGYAFKLPAAFVAMFPALADIAERMAAGSDGARSEQEIFLDVVSAMEAAASGYAISRLQAGRALRRGLKRVSGRLFSAHAKSNEWAFHHGGRDELQFNVGLDYMPDGSRAFRAGLAFSFETSRSLPDITLFIDKVARFNAWMREHPEDFGDLAMWHWRGGGRSADYPSGPIPLDMVREGVFIMLGARQSLEGVDPAQALEVFDRLLPLYEWVEAREPGTGPVEPEGAAPALDRLDLERGRPIEGGRWITATLAQRTLDIFLRHAEIQRRLEAMLLSEGCARVVTEAPIGERRIDLVAQHGEDLWFYEVKVEASVRACLRQAIGQLLEYSLWPGATRPARLVVVGEHLLDAQAVEYLTALNNRFPIPITYRQVSLS